MKIDSFNSIPAAFFSVAENHPDLTVYSQAQLSEDANGRREWKSASFAQVKERICKIASYLRSIGVKPGDKVAIISSSRPEWMEADIAVMAVGAIVVSVYQSLMPGDIGYILFDSGARYAFAENQEQLDKLQQILGKSLRIPGTEDREDCEVIIELEKIITFEKIDKAPNSISLSEVLSQNTSIQPDCYKEIKPADLACLVYTSGTTGPPKGVIQSHANHLANVRQAGEAEIYSDNSSIMLVLPLAHSFAKLMGYICFLTNTEIKFTAIGSKTSSKIDPDSMMRDIKEGSANIVPLVPRFLEKMKEGIEKKSSSPGFAGKLLKLCLNSSQQVYLSRQSGRGVSLKTKFQYWITAPIRKKISTQLFGPNFVSVVSGGAKLPIDVANFFESLSIDVLEGYGLTETCVATNVNRSGRKKIGTVGPVLSPDIQMKIAADGEILYKGPNITTGYYLRPSATRSSWDADGWFHTGDIGSVDEDGFLTITGRKKELIITAGGKKIAPDLIEQRIKSSPFISQAVLVGEGRPYCVAILTLNEPAIRGWAVEQGLNIPKDNIFGHSGEHYENLRQHLHREVDKINETLASFETIKKIILLDEDFTIENGLLTPTFKVKRNAVVKALSDRIDELYASGHK